MNPYTIAQMIAGTMDTASMDPDFKSKQTHPYNYSDIVTYIYPDVEADSTIYTDRLKGWGYEKLKELSLKHFKVQGDYWGERSPEEVQAFLREYCAAPNLVLTKITEQCNASNGYPLWKLDFIKGSL